MDFKARNERLELIGGDIICVNFITHVTATNKKKTTTSVLFFCRLWWLICAISSFR